MGAGRTLKNLVPKVSDRRLFVFLYPPILSGILINLSDQEYNYSTVDLCRSNFIIINFNHKRRGSGNSHAVIAEGSFRHCWASFYIFYLYYYSRYFYLVPYHIWSVRRHNMIIDCFPVFGKWLFSSFWELSQYSHWTVSFRATCRYSTLIFICSSCQQDLTMLIT